jgi:hypothetical protein
LDESGRLVAVPGEFEGGDWTPLAPVFGFVSTVSGLVATGCLVAVPFTEGASLACYGPAAAVSTGAGALEAGLGWAEGDPGAKCNTATFAVGVLLPGDLDAFGGEAFAGEVLHSAAGNAMDFACG